MSNAERERWRRLDALLERAMALPLEERARFLDSACGEDSDLRREIESLLDHDLSGSFLNHPAAEDAARLLAPSAPASLAGRRIGAFDIEEVIGHGGMGEVYAARDTRLGRRVAIKRLPAAVAGDPDRIRAFRREALAASGLNHPNILTVHEVVAHDEGDLLVTELIEGMTLRERLRGGPLSLDAALDILLPAARGLAAAHAAGIVHRDVKPENLMIRGDGLVKIVDFGIAKPVGVADDDTATVSRTDRIVGTLAYMSPEQARGLPVDARTDVWSLGVVLYEAVAGVHPFAGDTTSDRLAAILEREPKPPSRGRPELPPELDRLLARLLAKERGERPAGAAALVQELEALRANEANERSSLGGPRRGFRWLLAALAVVATVAVVLRLGTTGGDGPALTSLAVLPLDDRAAGADAGYLGAGVSDGMIRCLARAPGLRVLSRPPARRGDEGPPVAWEVGRRLGVAAVVVGRVAERENRLELTVDLVDTRDGHILWTASYDRPHEGLVTVHEEIARDLLRHLRIDLPERPGSARPPIVEAYRLYLQGSFHWHQSWRDFNPFLKLGTTASDSYERSRDYFQRAVEADPNLALAWSGLSHYWAYGAANGLLDPGAAWPRAENTVRRAFELDPDLPDVHNTLAGIHLYRDRDWSGGERELVTALELGGSAEVYIHYSLFKRTLGQLEESERLLRRALELDPLSLRANLGLADWLFRSGQLEESQQQIRHCLDLEPNSPVTYELLADLLSANGRESESIAARAESLRLQGDEDSALRLAATFERAGYREAIVEFARSRVERFERFAAKGSPIPAAFFARAYLLAGDRTQALAWANRAFGERNRFVLELATSRLFEPLREDPEFLENVNRLGLPAPG